MTYVLILIGHFAGDFLLQPKKLAELKKTSAGFLLLHVLIYMVPVSAAMAFFGWKVAIALPIIAASHFAIDFIRQLILSKKSTPARELLLFIADQLLHIALLLFAAYLFKSDAPIGIWYLVLCAIICTKPASVLVRYVLNALTCRISESRGEECEKEELGGSAGGIIGVLERLIMLIFGVMNLYSAIGLVFTAKSLARFKKFEERDFAEKYLVGTLLSMFIVILLLFIPKLLPVTVVLNPF